MDGVEEEGAAAWLDDEVLLVDGAAGLSEAFFESDFESEEDSPALEAESPELEDESLDLEPSEDSLELELLGA